jgi:AraC-like DNA-binding protein
VALVHYSELPPPPLLRERVSCAWVVHGAPDQGGHRVLPDGCTDVVWSDGALFLVGPMTTAVEGRARRAAGVRLRPGAARLLGLPASELLDARVDVAEAWGRAGQELAERLAACDEPEQVARLLLAELGRRLETAPPLDPVVQTAVSALAAARGVRVDELGRELYLSERQLRRRFLRDVGVGPAAFARVVRLHRLLALAPRSPAHTTLARLAVDAGYSDESHLARDARELAGVRPTVLLRDHAPLAR